MAAEDTVFEFRSGVRLHIKRKFSTMGVYEAARAIIDPEPPRFYPNGPGDTEVWEPNPNDPEYLAVLEANERRRNDVVQNGVIMLGTRIEEPLPEDVEGPEDADWEAQAAMGLVLPPEVYDPEGRVPVNRRLRYAYWVRLFAAGSGSGLMTALTEYAQFVDSLLANSGITEEAPLRLLAGFQGNEAGGAAGEDADPEAHTNGHRGGEDAVTGGRARGRGRDRSGADVTPGV